MKIPHEQLSPHALRGLIEEFVTREGTDVGHDDFGLEDKVRQVLRQLERNEVHITFDAESESCSIVATP